MQSLCATLLGVALFAPVGAPAQTAPPAAQPAMASDLAKSAEWFEEKIRPLLAARCFECHTNDASGGLRLDTREGLITGGESGSAIVPGQPDESLLIQAVRHAPKVVPMPKKAAKLKDEEIDALVQWVKAGAPWPAPRAQAAPSPGAPAASRLVITPEKRAPPYSFRLARNHP